MKAKKKRLVVAAAVTVSLLVAAVGLSETGRVTVSRWFSPDKVEPTLSTAGQPTQDVEQRARQRHGWNAGQVNAVIRGTITYYSREGQSRGQANLTITRKHPDKLRVEIERGGASEIIGFDGEQAWKSGAANLKEEEGRDIRAFLRLWPERLFLTRGGGASYKEAQKRRESYAPETPWRGAEAINPPAAYEQVIVEDIIGQLPNGQRVGDRRAVTYYVESEGALIRSARWLEPDDPRRRIDDARASQVDIRVDYGNYLQQGGVLWPMEIVRWLGGKVEFRLQIEQIQVNQPLVDSLFHNPNR